MIVLVEDPAEPSASADIQVVDLVRIGDLRRQAIPASFKISRTVEGAT